MENERGRIKIVPVAILLLVIAAIVYWLNPSLFKSYEVQAVDEFGFKGKIKSCSLAEYEATQKFGEWTIGSLRKKSFGHGGEGSTFQSNYNFDNKGNLISSDILMNGKFSSKRSYEYDSNGKLLQEKEYGGDGGLQSVIRIEYLVDDKTGSKEEHYKYNGEGKITWKDVKVFEKEEDRLRKVEITGFSPGWSDKLSDLTKFSYFTQDQMKYDEKENMISAVLTTYGSDGKLKNQNIHETGYDESGNMISTVVKNMEGVVLSSESYECIEFDEAGNCIKVLCNNDPSATEERYIKVRMFEYY